MAGRKRIGTIPSAILAGLGFLGTMAIGWTGGRDISVEAGEGRMDAWAEGLKLIQSHPIFGVGYNRFTEFYFITAHNTIVVCAAELGILGFFFWVLFVVPSYANSWKVANSINQTNSQALRADTNEPSPRPDVYTVEPPVMSSETVPNFNHAEVARVGQIVFLSLTAFLVAGWFISRSYVMTLFIIGGFAQVVFKMALANGIVEERMSWNKLLKLTSATTVSLLILVYIILRVSNLSR